MRTDGAGGLKVWFSVGIIPIMLSLIINLGVVRGGSKPFQRMYGRMLISVVKELISLTMCFMTHSFPEGWDTGSRLKVILFNSSTGDKHFVQSKLVCGKKKGKQYIIGYNLD